MILILSKSDDEALRKVCACLKKCNAEFVVLYETDTISEIRFKAGENTFSVELDFNNASKTLNLLTVKAYWYKNGFFPMFEDRSFAYPLFGKYQGYIQSEQQHIILFIHKYLQNIPSLNSFFNELHSNKLYNLFLAMTVGLKIPETFLLQKKESILELIGSGTHSYITKSIQREMHFEEEDYDHYTSGTNEVFASHFESLPQDIPPGLIQQKLEKKYEIRSYFIKESFFSMAIFSQNDELTKTDFRHYNESKPIRCIPYTLPAPIEEKLLRLAQKLNIDTGSFDLVYTQQDEYIFLEVNPAGQFHFLSLYCNYHLEKIIAETLINLAKTPPYAEPAVYS